MVPMPIEFVWPRLERRAAHAGALVLDNGRLFCCRATPNVLESIDNLQAA